MSCKSYGNCPLVRKLRLRRIGVTDPSRVDQVC
ncbi:hypothetical protein T4C_12322 [Trichinella pseudospiralis]|uniref:Uncharacterized protein n=1 Tax=Trichinella pseudospiralis TaxID=6337 RepID=A0A0V1GDG9_TRIPS|nr:hypothetical protein T4C_12322 [Trichinella pseudospiralis]